MTRKTHSRRGLFRVVGGWLAAACVWLPRGVPVVQVGHHGVDLLVRRGLGAWLHVGSHQARIPHALKFWGYRHVPAWRGWLETADGNLFGFVRRDGSVVVTTPVWKNILR